MSPQTMLPGMRGRVIVVAAVLCVGLVLMVAKAGRLQLGLGGDLKELAEQQYVRSLRFSAPRGNVYDRAGRPLAVSVPVWSISAAPRDIADPTVVAKTLAPLLKLDEAKLARKLEGRRAFTWLRRRLPPDVAEQVRALQLKGIGLHRESKRFYPGRELAGQLLGTVSIDGNGQSGVERAYDEHLRGRSISLPGVQDNKGRRMMMSGVDLEVLAGDDVYLTLDARLQHLTEQALVDGIEASGAKSGMAVVVDPGSGALLAVANAPLFNPNDPGASSAFSRRNHAFAGVFEPGSTFKAISFAAALDAGVVKPDERIFCENGKLKLGRFTIHDTHPEGWITAREAFKYSSNIGTLKIASRLGEAGFREAIGRFGFGHAPGLGFVEESAGLLPRAETWGEVRLATTSYGHGLGVTSLQLARAVAILANDGRDTPLTLLNRVESSAGEIVAEPPPAPSEQVVSAATANTVSTLMAAVFENGGTGYSVRIEGIEAAGKTGTAEKVDPRTGRYSKEDHTSSFVGFAPLRAPRFVVVVVLDEPQVKTSGAATAGPIWRAIMTGALVDAGLLAERPVTPTDGDQVAAAPAPIVKVDPRFADFIGLNAREALREADARGVQVVLSGTGRVSAVKRSTRDDGVEVLVLTLDDSSVATIVAPASPASPTPQKVTP
jgi:cell division protein FtsI (penicillin-binding protein 3)